MRRYVLSVIVCTLLTSSAALCGLKLPHVLHGSVDLRPHGYVDYYGLAYWQNHVYVTGWYDQYGTEANVWAVDVTDPDNPFYVNKTKWGGWKTWKPKAYDNKLYVAAWGTGVHMFDISAGALALYPYGIWDPHNGFFWDVEYNNGRAYALQSGTPPNSVNIVDVSAIGRYPTQVSQIEPPDAPCFGVSVRGSYLYVLGNSYGSIPDTSRASLSVYNISDERNPTFVKLINTRHGLSDMVRRGDYLYVSWGSWGHASYEGDVMPGVAEPPWNLVEGSEAYSSLTLGSLRIEDNSTDPGSKAKWRREWPTTTLAANGTTTVFRARCLTAGGDTTDIVNVQIEDGAHRERFKLLTDRIVAMDSGLTHMINGRSWHTYCVVTKDDTFKLYVDDYWFPVMTGTMTATTPNKRITFGGGADAATQDFYFDYIQYNCREDLPPLANYNGYVRGGLDVYDISEQTNPVLVGEYRGIGGGGDISLLGNGAFMPDSGMLTCDISDPTNPKGVSQFGLPGYAGPTQGNGRYIYTISGDGTHTNVCAIEVLDADPDVYGPSLWSDCSLGEASWDTEYFGDTLPSVSGPAWSVAPGDSEALASSSGGVLRINDNSGSSKLQWVRNWDATMTFGTTVLFRARCGSYDLNGADISDLNAICIEDGKYKEEFALLSDRIRAKNADLEFFLDGTQWHTYRITTKNAQFKVYIDEVPAPILTGPMSSLTSRARIWFGSSSAQGMQDLYFDYLQCFSTGAYPPPAHTTSLTPDVSVKASDWVEQDSISGINPASARVQWSTDGGVTWSAPGLVLCYGSPGDVAGIPVASAIPFNQYSDTLNKVRFSMEDMLGNIGYSPVYNVRILDPNPPAPVIGLTATDGDALVKLSWTNPTSQQYAGTMIRYKTSGYPTSPTDGTLLVNRLGMPGAPDGCTHVPVTNGAKYYYAAFAYDKALGYSPAAYALATPRDMGAPGPVMNLTAVGANGQVSLSWTNPSSPDFNSTMVRYSTEDYPATPTDGTLLTMSVNTPGSTDGYTHTGVENGVTYYYSAWARDAVPNYSVKVDASATPSPGLCWIEQFAYPDGELGDYGTWIDPNPAIKVENQTVRITGGATGYETSNAVTCEGLNGIIWVRFQAKGGGGSGMMWDVCINDTAGNNLARWYGGPVTARPRLGGTSNVLPVQQLTGGWDTLDIKIDTKADENEFFFNGKSIGKMSHKATNPGDMVGEVVIGRIDNSIANGSYIFLDNFTIGGDLVAPGSVTEFRALGGDGKINLSWANPSDPDFVGTKILCKATGYPTGPTDGTVIYNGPGTSAVHNGLANGTRYYYSAFAYDGLPNHSIGTNASARPAAETTILEAKGLPDGQLRTLTGNVVSATGDGFFYIQDPTAYQGLRVVGTQAVSLGQQVDVVGVMEGQGAERSINCSLDSIAVMSPTPAILPVSGLGMLSAGGSALNDYTPGVVGGIGPNNIGLLVRVWGKVTQRDTTGLAYFYIDDGSGLRDGTQTAGVDNTGIRVLADPTSYPSGSYVAVTGVISCLDSNGLRPQILPRTGDIQTVEP